MKMCNQENLCMSRLSYFEQFELQIIAVFDTLLLDAYLRSKA